MFDKLIKDNNLIITDSNNKEILIKYISSMNNLCNVKIITFNELIKGYYFDYDEQAIYYLMTKYNIKGSVARIYINSMYYVDSIKNNTKIDNIYSMKQELIDNKLLIINEYYKDFLSNKNIIIYNNKHIPNNVKNILDNYKYEVILDENKNYKHSIYEFNNIDEEISFVAVKIIDLIKSGIDINNIYLANLNDEYRLLINRIFGMYNIPVSLDIKYSLYNLPISDRFIKLYESNIENTLINLEKTITKDEVDSYNKIVNICNKYIWCDDYNTIKELVIDSLKNTNICNNIKENSIKEINLSSNIDDNKYVFLFSFNQGIIPIIHKDEDYFSDKDKLILGVETSVDKNLVEKDKLINNLSNIKNLIITYKLKTITDTFSISNINDNLEYEVIKNNNIDYNYSNLYNKIILSKNLDLFNKYGTINDSLKTLYSNYKDINYRVYNNKFTGIDNSDLYKLLDNKLLLSYSSLDNYNRCSFRYYLNNILKVSDYEESFMQLIGNLFHYVLSKAFLPGFNYDEVFDNYIEKSLTKKEEFFINKLKNELRFIIDTINEHNKHTSLNDELFEEKVYINLEGNIKVTFMGIIDKLKYKEVDGEYIVAIIDYKTGNPNLNLNNVIYGIEMQLPVYIYLTRNHPKFNNIKVAGFYLQKILNNEIKADGKNKYEDLKKKNLLLQGYSNENIGILDYFDDSYADSVVVKSLKQTSKGFSSYSKVLDTKTINELTDLAESKIKESTKDILDGKFDINPKRIGINNLGCEFCQFKDICFKTEKDIVNLEEYKNLEFLGGDDNGMDA